MDERLKEWFRQNMDASPEVFADFIADCELLESKEELLEENAIMDAISEDLAFGTN